MTIANIKKALPPPVKAFLKNALQQLDISTYGRIYKKYAYFTMIPKTLYKENLRLTELVTVDGAVVECGAWRGGMAAGMAERLGPQRHYYLYDSFAGLPPAKVIDGATALAWQNDTTSAVYYDNCTADITDAKRAMALARVPHECVKGWFEDTVPKTRWVLSPF